MPYIRQEDRSVYEESIDHLISDLEEQGWQAGHLNYAVSRLLKAGFESNRSYSQGSKLRGAINDASLEFYRRSMVPYEEEKIEENGDI